MNFKYIWFWIISRLTQNSFERAMDETVKYGFYHGPFIYHTKANPGRTIRRALPADSIANLKRHLKYRWPIRWWIQEELPMLRYKIPGYHLPRRFREWNWKRKNPQHKVEPRNLTKGKYYASTEIATSCLFEIIQRYYEKDYPRYEFFLDTNDSDIPDEHMEFATNTRARAKRLLECVEYWNEKRPAIVADIEERWKNVPKVGPDGEFLAILRSKYKNTPEAIAYNIWSEELRKIEAQLRVDDEEMSELAIKVIYETC